MPIGCDGPIPALSNSKSKRFKYIQCIHSFK